VEIDDILYEAFAPQRLTETFQKAKTLQLPSTKTLWGLEPGPVLKLFATVVMIGVMAGTSILTQTQDLKDAADALCGTRTGLVRPSRDLPSSRRVCAGGPVDWAYGVDKFGLPLYTTLGADVSSWLDKWGKDPFEPRVWSRPAEETAQVTLHSKFVDTVLTSPQEDSRCNAILCQLKVPELDSMNMADTFPWGCCLAQFYSVESTLGVVQIETALATPELVVKWSPELGSCGDLLNSGSSRNSLNAVLEGIAMDRLARLMNTDGSNCEGGCPFLRPLCNGTQCVRPTCQAVKENGLCRLDGDDGALVRLVCSVTCGCNDPLSNLVRYGSQSGCPLQCAKDGAKRLLRRDCEDARPNSTAWTSLVDFATANATVDIYFAADPPHGVRLWSTLGCFAVFLYGDGGGLCDADGSFSKLGTQSFRSFCPQTCLVVTSRVRQDLKAAQVAYPTKCDAAAVENPFLHFNPFCKWKPDGSFTCDNANVSVALKLGANDDRLNSHCTDLSDAQLAMAHEWTAALKVDPPPVIPRSCSTASANSPTFFSHSNSSLTCDDLFGPALVYDQQATTEGVRFVLARHPCPVACHACPPQPVIVAGSLTDSSEAT
jgi:hypothetical protein